jgi:hypothetical protein
MKNQGQHIRKYLRYTEDRLKSHLSNFNLDQNIRESLESKLDSFKYFSDRINFQLQTPDERQSSRIKWLASLRKTGKPTETKIATIRLYDKIREVLPYLEVLNTNEKVQSLIILCLEELELIDFANMNFGENHVSLDLVNELFNKVIESEVVFAIHPEALNKIQELYNEFKGIFG